MEHKRLAVEREVVTKTVEVVDMYQLTLTKSEAETLYRVSQRISGDPKGRRGDMDAVGKALRSMGIGDPGERITIGDIFFREV